MDYQMKRLDGMIYVYPKDAQEPCAEFQDTPDSFGRVAFDAFFRGLSMIGGNTLFDLDKDQYLIGSVTQLMGDDL